MAGEGGCPSRVSAFRIAVLGAAHPVLGASNRRAARGRCAESRAGRGAPRCFQPVAFGGAHGGAGRGGAVAGPGGV